MRWYNMIEALSIIVFLGTVYLVLGTVFDAMDTIKERKEQKNREDRLAVKAEARKLLEESRRKK